ncbi:MAG: DEAD/DEAH box helicase family protein, partial [Lentisphaerae bacterium]|nr:DEAD/DEAH box helicase family protein [Lentisphaerota bacterium]
VYEDANGERLPPAQVQRTLLRGDACMEHGGRIILLDAGAIATVNDIFSDCASRDGARPGAFRLSGVYAAYVQSALSALDGIDIEAPEGWLRRADRQNRVLPPAPVILSAKLESILRPYQKEGVTWLRFLEQSLFNGILADDMGLGKTVQALSWISQARLHPQIMEKPCLVVCPTSLVENWAEEAHRFAPELRLLTLSGAERHGYWDELEHVNMAITSYALLRRDVEKYLKIDFAVIVLDEAQHIKNRSTMNAVAAKRLRSMHRLVLTGTPMENSIADLWSIMDFLMPGYLGSYESFRRTYELPSAQAGPEAEQVRLRLRRKLHPFVLRRLKIDVARDLPPKIERTAICSLTTDQQRIYDGLLEQSRRRLITMVAERGFQHSRMEILKTLLRLRQVCCHLALLKQPLAPESQPSAKLELFMELLDEAVDGGHRVLVFSQFTSMLFILRRRLEEAALKYSYLDGMTRERQRVVREFNARRDVPVFLMSLKAGGTGLNITGADMVIHYDRPGAPYRTDAHGLRGQADHAQYGGGKGAGNAAA